MKNRFWVFKARKLQMVLIQIVLGIAVFGSFLDLAMAVNIKRPVAIKFSGILGQSQPEGDEPLPFIGTGGVAMDKKGNLWTGAGTELFKFSKQGGNRWIVTGKLKLSAPIIPYLGLYGDGERIFFISSDWKVQVLNPATDSVLPLCSVKSNSRIRFAVAPAALTKGYAAKAKIFILEGDRVRAYREAGSSVGTVFSLTRPEGVKWYYSAIGIEPKTGDLLIGSSYPDRKIYRFDAQGNEVTTDGWPRTVPSGNASYIMPIRGEAWQIGSDASSLPLSQTKDAFVIKPYWTYYPYGITEDPTAGGYWIASTQGLSHFDKYGRPTGNRLGGISGIRSMAVADDGTLIAAVEKGQRMIRLSIADEPTTPFISNGNEPWRVGAGWTNKASGISWDGSLFLVLDETGKQLWHFDPWHTGWGEKPWIKLTGPHTFSNPRALAAGDTLVWVLDGNRLLEGRQSNYIFHEVKLPGRDDLSGIITIGAGKEDNIIVLATHSRLKTYSRSAKGSYKFLWDSPVSFRDITSIAVTPDYVITADKKERSITLLSLKTGKELGQISADKVKGGMLPISITASHKWLLVADEAGKRIIRFKIE